MASLDLVIGNGITNKTIAVSDTTPMIQRAQDATTAILTAFSPSTQTFKVIWGFSIVAGFNDRITHAANLNGTATNVSCDVPVGNYVSGAALASAVQTAMQTAEDAFAGGKRVDITVTYSEGTGKFNWAWTEVRATISQFIIRTPTNHLISGLDVVGIQRGSDQVGSGASGNFDADYEVRVNRFKFTFGGAAGSVRLADVAFTAEAFFGITDTTNKTILAYLCNLDVLDAPVVPPPAVTVRPSPLAPDPASVGTSSQLRVLIPKYFDEHDWAWWNREMHWSGSTDFDMTVLRGNLKERMLAFSEGERGIDLPARPGPTKGSRETG